MPGFFGGTKSSNTASSSSEFVSAVNPEAVRESPVLRVAGDVKRDVQAANRDAFAFSR
jgi:hypothetical protein